MTSVKESRLENDSPVSVELRNEKQEEEEEGGSRDEETVQIFLARSVCFLSS